MQRSRRELSSWERFCREDARETASRFLERVRSYKERDPSAREIHDSFFASEFSCYFLEEITTLASSRTGRHNSAYEPPNYKPSSKGASGGKPWWSIFRKFSKTEREKKPLPSMRPGVTVVMDGVVSLLNFNDSSQSESWQQCRLVLLHDQGNYQLEVFCPPKNLVPKMSLFCFLIEDVRSTTSLELPDSDSAFVIKSQNHGEYVFDTGCEDSKQLWIRHILQYSSKATAVTNGHVPNSPGSVSNGRVRKYGRSLSTSAVGHARLLATHEATDLKDTARHSGSPEQDLGLGGRSCSPGVYVRTTAEAIGSIPTVSNSDSEESVLCDVSLLIRNHPYRSPQRKRKVQSMYIESPSSPFSPQPSHVSPHSSPPPLPKKGQRPQSVIHFHKTFPSPSKTSTSPAERRRKFSQSNVPDYSAISDPSSLVACSLSSSTSALHPVSLAAAAQRSMAAKTGEGNHLRKISAPVLMHNVGPQQLQVEDSWIYREDMNSEQREPGAGTVYAHTPDQGYVSAIEDSQGGNGLESQRGMLSSELASFRHPSGSDSPNEPPFQSEDITPSSTRSSSTSDAELHQVSASLPIPGNPIYVETRGEDSYYQPVTHTHHPYKSWATRQQDVENLRNLSQYPWFHGMISRANASQLVLTEGELGLGQYLVRQSESREGDFVLTFNYHNRAKHLRMAVDETGCNIQHLWFDSVPSMLEYFKTNSIPLESFWLNDDVKLTSFIDRTASDTFRTTTVVNVDHLRREPPRRSRSLHFSTSHAVVLPNTPSPTGSTNSSQETQSNSLPNTVRSSISWRQMFRSQRSSSAGNVARVQRRHSTNANAMMDTRRGQRDRDRSGNNHYVYRS